ncbi:ribose-phosphate pyrophosphokinase [Zalerion maritima]|uniref:Ribose-phosphate pyrophosphokinase n=1 Tax=Zalerion maritima TaxID=339359 RepID=A0AAD5WPM4_9PEZI|nr:ribose-phosphate pyrophosphokinase [Zalerion maritima]
MVRNIVVLGGNSHPHLTENICNMLGIPSCDRILNKFSVGESRCEIKDSVRGKDVYIIQTGSGNVNDNFMDLCIMISACKTGSAKRVTAILPLFPYSRQPDIPYNKVGAPLNKTPSFPTNKEYTFESVPATPGPGVPKTNGLNITNGIDSVASLLSKSYIADQVTAKSQTNGNMNGNGVTSHPQNGQRNGTNGTDTNSEFLRLNRRSADSSLGGLTRSYTTHDVENAGNVYPLVSQAQPGYKQWVAQAGTLVAALLTAAGADHVITMDLHDPQYQGFFDVPVDNLYGKPLLKRYIQQSIPDYHNAVIVSPDAGGAKRATSLADSLNMPFALIHKERRAINYKEPRKATMMLVGDVRERVCILVDDLADTGNTITRAAKLCKKEGASCVYALLTHGVLSGDAIARINASSIDKMIVTNSVPQMEHRKACPKLEVIDIAPVFAEAIRRVHHGESISVLFQYD